MNSTDLKCPKCKSPMLPGSVKCRCGWKTDGISKENSMQCSHVYDGRRCRLVGESSPRGARDWYCAWHNFCLSEGVQPDNKEAFLKFVSDRAKLSERENKLKAKGIQPIHTLWRGPTEVLWQKMMALPNDNDDRRRG